MTPEQWEKIRATFDIVLACPAPERAARLATLAAGDAELEAEVNSLLAAHHSAERGFLDTPAIDMADAEPMAGATQIGRRIGPYEILEEIGHGGMGIVYRARRVDGQYTQDVALKLVHAGITSPLLLPRFLNERQILATLEHENIARLLDGGTTETGLPYLVMERVTGLPIDQYCDAHQLSISARLTLFEKVCAAVAYAHQRLVIHRDIKPGNILVTAAGVPKLLDFGIAKLQDAPDSSQTTLLRPMTPEYASPEQLLGKTVTTTSDVYSLAVVLYRLLTGLSPYPSTGNAATELARTIAQTDPLPPSHVVAPRGRRTQPSLNYETREQRAGVREGTPLRLRRRLHGDLDNILLKALRKEPEQRYASVEQFADDIRRHLAGLPVLATKGSFRYRAGKFLIRHRAAVAAVALLLLTLIGGVVAALREAQVAAANGRLAEARFNDVRHLANSLIFEVHDAIEPLPGSTPVRELIVRRALEYLDRLSREAQADTALRRELALAYEKVASVQGAPSGNNLGNSPGALASYQKALALRRALSDADPVAAQPRIDLARTYGAIGDLQHTMGDLKAALASYEQGLALIAPLPSPGPEARQVLMTLDLGYGVALDSAGELPKAATVFRNAVTLGERLTRDEPTVPARRLDYALAYMHLGNAYLKMGRFPDALENYRASHALLNALASAGPGPWHRAGGVVEERLADTYQRMGIYPQMLALRHKILAEDVEALRQDPANARARRDVYIDYYKLARSESLVGDLASAIANERHSLELIERERIADPANSNVKNDAQIGYFHLGDMLRKAGRLQESLQAFERSKDMVAQMVKDDPSDLDVRADYSEAEVYTADIQLLVGKHAAALANYTDAVTRLEQIVSTNPSDAEWLATLALAYAHRGHYDVVVAGESSGRASAPHWLDANKWLSRSVAIWSDLDRQHKVPAEVADEPAKVAAELARVRQSLSPAALDGRQGAAGGRR